jgi:hypothetical protein
MHVVITDLVVGKCELSAKEGVECLRLQLDEHSREITCRPGELIKLLRLTKSQESKSVPSPAQVNKGAPK